MGHKINPISNRLGFIKGWYSNWYGGKNYGKRIKEDYEIRKFLEKHLPKAILSRIYIERTLKFITITITTSRPGIIIGKGGKQVDEMIKIIKKITNKDIQINIFEIHHRTLDALLLANNLATKISNRVFYKKAIKSSINDAFFRMDAEGIKVQVSGRINGAEMARTESYKEGRIPLSTLRADIDYATSEAITTYGVIGIKVWIMKGEIYYNRKNLYSMFSMLDFSKKKKKSKNVTT